MPPFSMNNSLRNIISSMRKRLLRIIIGLMSFFALSCDFQNPMAFEMPTWFFDLSFPLVQKKYSLEGMVDNKQIFSTPDSIGMQLMFEGILPDTSVGTDILEVELNQNIKYNPATVSPNFSFSLDTTINLNIPIAPGGKLTNSAGTVFSIPPSSNQTVTQSVWNTIASAIDTKIQVLINLPSIPSSQLPTFIQSVDGLIIKADAGATVSDFVSTFTNDGLPTNVIKPTASMLTDITSPPKTLASHTQATLAKDASYGPTSTSLSQDSLGNAIRWILVLGLPVPVMPLSQSILVIKCK